MWAWLTELDGVQRVDDVRLGLRAAWPALAVLLVVLGAVALGLSLYIGYRRVAPRLRWVLAATRATLVALLVVLLFEPVLTLDAQVVRRSTLLVLIDGSASMNIADARTAGEDVRRAAMAAGRIRLDQPDADVPVRLRQQLGEPDRLTLAAALLDDDGAQLLSRLRRDYQVRAYRFAASVAALDTQTPLTPAALRPAEPRATALGEALKRVAELHAGQPIAAVLAITDGASNTGIDPTVAAGRLGERRIRVHAIGIGLDEPDDVAVQQIVVQEVVFPRDRVPVQVTLRCSGYAGRPAVVKLTLDDREVASRAVNLTGGTQFETFEFIPTAADVGSRQLRVSVSAMPGEATLDNNARSRSVLVTDRRIRVLYVEGKPRWEYRYLRRVLQRDRRLEVTYLMTEGDPELAANAREHIARFPTDADEAFAYDLVIVGDVPASTFNAEQFARIEQLVAEQGGSMLMLAGRRFAPAGYRGTPIEKMLPVRLGSARQPWFVVEPNVHPVLTVSGERAGVMRLSDADDDPLLWRRVAPMHRLADLAGAKPGAVTWLTLSDTARRPGVYPLVAWHRYGSGRVLYVGTDALWRLRFRTGSIHHERFWSQSIQFMALARLLAGRERVRLETDRRQYVTGEPVRIFATVQDEAWQPMRAERYDVLLRRTDTADPGRTLTLDASAQRPGVFSGVAADLPEGRYSVEPLTDAAEPSGAPFAVKSADLELREPALQFESLRRIAEASGGVAVRLDGVPALLDALRADRQATRRSVVIELWDLPLTYLLIVALAGAEWYLRRRSSLP